MSIRRPHAEHRTTPPESSQNRPEAAEVAVLFSSIVLAACTTSLAMPASGTGIPIHSSRGLWVILLTFWGRPLPRTATPLAAPFGGCTRERRSICRALTERLPLVTLCRASPRRYGADSNPEAGCSGWCAWTTSDRLLVLGGPQH